METQSTTGDNGETTLVETAKQRKARLARERKASKASEGKADKVVLSPAQKAREKFLQADAYADMVIESTLPERNGKIRGRTSFAASQTVAGLSS